MRSLYYKLGADGRTPEEVPSVDDYMAWLGKDSVPRCTKQVAKDERGDVTVSTVFLGLDHGWSPGPPILFETMVFGGRLDGEMNRYATWEEAEQGHAEMVARVGSVLG